MCGKFNKDDDWNNHSKYFAVPLGYMQKMWTDNQAQTLNHFSRDFVIISCEFQQVKVDSNRYWMTAFSPTVWNDFFAVGEFLSFRFKLLDNQANIDYVCGLETRQKIYVKCKLDGIYSDTFVAFKEAEVLLDYVAPMEEFKMFREIQQFFFNQKRISSFVPAVSSITNWPPEICRAFYFNLFNKNLSMGEAASEIPNTMENHTKEINGLQKAKPSETGLGSKIATAFWVIVLLLVLKSCMGG